MLFDSGATNARRKHPMSGWRVMGAALAAVALVTALPTAGSAQEWPSRPVRFVVPFPAGGSTDIVARTIAAFVSRDLGQQVYVENRSGANGNIGMEAAAASAPDGYTFLVTGESIASNPYVYKMNVDLIKGLIPVVQMSTQPIVLAAHPSLGVKSIAELVALAKQKPGLSYATGSGAGSQQHMVVQWFTQIAGIDLVQVPYRGGGAAITDLLGGQVQLGSLGSAPLIPYYKAGTLLMLAQSTGTRSPSLPDVPTFEEAGIKGLVLDQWVGVFAPAKTPPAITQRLATEIGKALADPAIRDSFQKAGLDPATRSPQEFREYVGEESKKFERLVSELHIKVN
jgi:tripartite-type tricarboxylate transporter receptor subunit TctC